jgi:hypothetical protein
MEEEKMDLIYKIQILSSTKELDKDSLRKAYGIKERIQVENYHGLYKYLTGTFGTISKYNLEIAYIFKSSSMVDSGTSCIALSLFRNLSGINVLNPFGIMGAFLAGSKPSCQNVKMETIVSHNNHSSEMHYVTTVDLQNMDPCNFPGNTNLVTGKSCKESFTNNTTEKSNNYSNYNLDDNGTLNGNYNLPKDALKYNKYMECEKIIL